MTEKCELHDGVEKRMELLFDKLDKVGDKLNKFYIVIVVLAILAGANTARGVLEFATKLAGH
jgi:hypothetical protein